MSLQSDPGARPAVVLIHGVGLDHRMWSPVLGALEADFDLFTPDLPGHGQRAPLRSEEPTLGDFAQDVSSVIPQVAHIVGFSLGALVALALALEHPERVRSVVLISCVAHRSRSERAAVRQRLEAARVDPQRNLEAAIERWTGGDPERLPPATLDYLRNVLGSIDRLAFIAAYRVFAEADVALWPRLPMITTPTLAVTGSEDPGSTPRMARALAQVMPDARAELIPGARHLLPLERASTVSELIRNHIRESL